jgi:site-specific DNA-methyltransferase (adenine-specific)/modification methylase
MPTLQENSVDMVLTDLPYEVLNKGNQHAQWDKMLPMNELWQCLNRVTKSGGAILLFSQGMFTAKLMMSNPQMWRYNLIWDKVAKTGFLNANRMPLRQHEDICVFYDKLPTYNPQMIKCAPHQRNHGRGSMKGNPTNRCYGEFIDLPAVISDEKFPTSIISIPKEHKNGSFYHPTQKAVPLLEYLIKTYSNEGDTILDATMGSGSTMVACVNTNRNGIGIELEDKYFAIAQQRVKQAKLDKRQNLFAKYVL